MTLTVFLLEVLRWFVGTLLLAAAWGKLRHLAEFRHNLVSSFGLPARLSPPAALAVPLAELLVAALLLAGNQQTCRIGMALALLMFCAFTALLSYKFVTSSVVRCSCFGESGRPISGYDLLRNLLVMLACLCWLLIIPTSTTIPIALPLPLTLLAAALATILCVLAIEFHTMLTALLAA